MLLDTNLLAAETDKVTSASSLAKRMRNSSNALQRLRTRRNFSYIPACFLLVIQRTRSSADADNRLDAFSGQSRSTNMVPFHM